MASKMMVTVGLVLNLISAIGIVMLNKLIYVRYSFPSMSLTLIHFLVTSLCLQICVWLNIFSPKRLQPLKVVPLAMSFCGFVVFTNLSLQFNTVGTYQLVKSMTTPVILFLQALFYSKKSSLPTKLTVIPVLMGIFLNSYYDVQFNALGLVFAGIGVLVTSIYQIWVSTKQSEFAVNSMQLLYYQAPLSSVMLLCVVVICEPVLGAVSSLPLEGMFMILMSGLVAFMVNLSIFWVIGKTSPLTYNMVGHCKFCITLLGGFYIFDDPVASNQLLGILCTVCGIGMYSYFKLTEQAREKANTAILRKPLQNA